MKNCCHITAEKIKKDRKEDDRMRTLCMSLVGVILCIDLVSNVETLKRMPTSSEKTEMRQSIDRLRHFALKDSALGAEENYGHTAAPEHEPV